MNGQGKKEGAGMTVNRERSGASPSPVGQAPGEDSVARVTQLQQSLMLCPTDILTRCELAALLEHLEQHEEALFNWKAVLACDPNNLTARERLGRCRQ